MSLTDRLDWQEDKPTWPRLGALVTIPGRDGIWSVWSRGADHPSDRGKWWVIPVDATERDRADLAVLLREAEIMPYVPVETGDLW